MTAHKDMMSWIIGKKELASDRTPSKKEQIEYAVPL